MLSIFLDKNRLLCIATSSLVGGGLVAAIVGAMRRGSVGDISM